jgi:endonuclease-8
MPEGDTLYNLAARLRPVLLGRTLRFGRTDDRGDEPLTGRAVRDIAVRGKHLLITLDDDTTLHVHLGMTGRFAVRPLNEPGPAPAADAALVFETDADRVVGEHLPVLERLTTSQLARHPQLTALGPDLLAETFDARAVAARFGAALYQPIGEALLDQRLACGIGNVYKSEVLFLEAVDPFSQVASLGPARLATVLEHTRLLMRRNLGDDLRRTRRGLDADRYWVYGREGLPCKRCGEPVAMRRQGDLARSTYYCAVCQGVGGGVAGRARAGATGRTKC